MYLKKFDLSGRVAVVTGAGQGIGLACAEALCEAGAAVLLTDISTERCEAGRAALAAKGYGRDRPYRHRRQRLHQCGGGPAGR